MTVVDRYGQVTSSKAILDQKTGECKGYGFALFEKEADCHTAIDGLNNAGLQASFARVGQESFSSRLRNLQDETSTNIYISNLPLDMTEQVSQASSHMILSNPNVCLARNSKSYSSPSKLYPIVFCVILNLVSVEASGLQGQ